MTMGYTHIGLEDQARAVQNLPTDPEWLHIGCTSGVSEGHSQSTEDTGCHSEAAGSGDTSPCEMSPYDTHRQKKAPPVTDGAEWRRRESNEDAEDCNRHTSPQVTTSPSPLSAYCQQFEGTDSRNVTVADATLSRVTKAWHELPVEVQQAVDAMCLQPVLCELPDETSLGHSALAEIVSRWTQLPQRHRQVLVSMVRYCTTKLIEARNSSTDDLNGASKAEVRD
jgi:hypothetical protein